MSDLGKYQNSIKDLSTLGNLRYENIFKVYKDSNSYYFYNIMNTISFPNISDSSELYTYITVNEKMPWTVISYNAYATIDLWWLIALINGVKNPFDLPEAGTLKILKPQYVAPVISQLSQSLA
jgi:hypothetical protein